MVIALLCLLLVIMHMLFTSLNIKKICYRRSETALSWVRVLWKRVVFHSFSHSERCVEFQQSNGLRRACLFARNCTQWFQIQVLLGNRCKWTISLQPKKSQVYCVDYIFSRNRKHRVYSVDLIFSRNGNYRVYGVNHIFSGNGKYRAYGIDHIFFGIWNSTCFPEIGNIGYTVVFMVKKFGTHRPLWKRSFLSPRCTKTRRILQKNALSWKNALETALFWVRVVRKRVELYTQSGAAAPLTM